MYAEVATIYSSNKSSIHEIVKGKKKVPINFTAELQAAKVMPTLCDNCFVKKEKALSLYKKIFEGEKDNIYISIYSILLYCPIFYYCYC